MQFRDLKTQYQQLKPEIDMAISKVLNEGNFISGYQVEELEKQLADYVGVKHCIACANGTDALTLAFMAWDLKEGDAVFVPDFTFFASAETVALEGATPIFIDVEENTFNISPNSLRDAIKRVLEDGKLKPKAIVAVDLFGLPANYDELRKIADEYELLLLEDGAQGFGGMLHEKRACSFGDISTTSFFPAKPLGCYGDGGAIFTDNDGWAELIRSYRIHGKGSDKYDNVRIGMNSRLDTIQAAILQIKLNAFKKYELESVNQVAGYYTKKLKELVQTPIVPEGFYSSWAQYSILLSNKKERDGLQKYLKENNIPSMIYYPKPMHEQQAFAKVACIKANLKVSRKLCERVLALPMHPYLTREEQDKIVTSIERYFKK